MKRDFSNGAATVTLDFDSSEAVAAAVNLVSGGLLEALETVAKRVADDAARKWYRAGEEGVTRRTGTTGVLHVRSKITSNSLTVGIYPDRKEAFYVHRPGFLSLVPRFVSRAEWDAARKAGRSTAREKTGAKRWIVYEVNPHRGDGKFLFPSLVRGPFAEALKLLPAEMQRKFRTAKSAPKRRAPRKAR